MMSNENATKPTQQEILAVLTGLIDMSLELSGLGMRECTEDSAVGSAPFFAFADRTVNFIDVLGPALGFSVAEVFAAARQSQA
jgi:hypothetical protein